MPHRLPAMLACESNENEGKEENHAREGKQFYHAKNCGK